jgi:hypothetical protein
MISAAVANLRNGSNQYKVGRATVNSTQFNPVTIPEAAEMFEISPDTVKRARVVLEHGDQQEIDEIGSESDPVFRQNEHIAEWIKLVEYKGAQLAHPLGGNQCSNPRVRH